jgi:hypothetical protein
MKTDDYLMDKFGPLMTPRDAAQVLHYKNADCLRAAMSYWADRKEVPSAIQLIRGARRKLGRRTYYVTEQIAGALACVLAP